MCKCELLIRNAPDDGVVENYCGRVADATVISVAESSCCRCTGNGNTCSTRYMISLSSTRLLLHYLRSAVNLHSTTTRKTDKKHTSAWRPTELSLVYNTSRSLADAQRSHNAVPVPSRSEGRFQGKEWSAFSVFLRLSAGACWGNSVCVCVCVCVYVCRSESWNVWSCYPYSSQSTFNILTNSHDRVP